MIGTSTIRRRTLTAMGLLTLATLGGAAAARAGDSTVCEAYWDQRYDQALQLAREIVNAADVSTADKVDAYRCEACTHVAKREIDPAKTAITGMLRLDNSARFSPDTSYPPPVLDLYHAVRDSLFPGTMDVETVAIGDFEDNSVYKGKFGDYDFSLFQRALVHMLNADLAAATNLKLVDRQRIETIQSEIQLGQSGFANPEQAVKAGQLLGAHTYVFGQYMILSRDKVRIDARVVRTATGEILLTKQVTGDFGGDPQKFLQLEQELVVAIAGGIEEVLSANQIETDLEGRTQEYFSKKVASTPKEGSDYVESKFLTAMALEKEDAGDYEGAREVWRQVLEADPGNEVAPVRIQVLGTLMQG